MIEYLARLRYARFAATVFYRFFTPLPPPRRLDLYWKDMTDADAGQLAQERHGVVELFFGDGKSCHQTTEVSNLPSTGEEDGGDVLAWIQSTPWEDGVPLDGATKFGHKPSISTERERLTTSGEEGEEDECPTRLAFGHLDVLPDGRCKGEHGLHSDEGVCSVGLDKTIDYLPHVGENTLGIVT